MKDSCYLASFVKGALAMLVIIAVALFVVPAPAGGSPNGAAGQMQAYYDGKLFTINLMELPGPAAVTIIAQNKSLNEMYVFDGALPSGEAFVMVLDAIQGDGFNPLWREVGIEFNPGFTPHQFFSDVDIEAAALGSNPEIRLIETAEVYRCSVVGKKH